MRELEPLLSEFLQVNYAKASDLAELMKGKGGASKGNSMLSERGSVAIDERTNTLLVQDVSENLAQIRRLVSTLDIPVRQVLIESRIVIVNDDFSRELGSRHACAEQAVLLLALHTDPSFSRPAEDVYPRLRLSGPPVLLCARITPDLSPEVEAQRLERCRFVRR